MSALKSLGSEIAPKNHVAYIDGLRAIAVLAVIVDHCFVHAPNRVSSAWAYVGYFGLHGVELFFVISGLCLAGTYLRRRERTGDLGFDGPVFFAKRIVRILPPYYIVVAVYAVLATWWAPWRAATDAPEGGSMADHVTIASLIAHAFFADHQTQTLNASFWTLRIEAIWYVLFPLVLFAFVIRPWMFWVAAGFCSIAAFFAGYGSPHGSLGTFFAVATAMPAFMLGIVSADPRVERALSRTILWILFVVSVAVGAAADEVWGIRVVWGVAAFAFVLLAKREPWLNRALSWRPLTFIGVISYSVYLIHEPMIVILGHARVPMALAAVGAIAAGAVYWYAVERPFIEDPLRGRLVRAVTSALRSLSGGFARRPAARDPR